MALSPNGQTIACGGVEGEVLIFDRETGRLTHRLQGFPNIITHLAYSRDGRWLVMTLGGQQGIRLYDAKSYTQVDQDAHYGAASQYAEFSHDGRLITVSDDGHLRLYELAAHTPSPLKLIGKRKVAGDRPRSASFSPDGSQLAVGLVDHPRVDLVSGKDLSHLATLNTSKADDDQYFISVAWSSDGHSLYGAGSYQERGKTGQARGTTIIRRWTIGADNTFEDYPVSEGSVEQLLSLKNGDVVFATHDPALGLIAASGARTQYLGRPIADFRGMGEEFKISEDARSVCFAYDRRKSFTVFSLPARSFAQDPPADLVLQIGAKKMLLLMDACKSAFALQAFSARGVDERQALAQLARANGVHTVAASTKDQFASEVQELGHDVFTYTLLEGLQGQADGSPKDGIVTVRELLAFVEARLPKLSLKFKTERQYPVAESRGMDFTIAVIK